MFTGIIQTIGIIKKIENHTTDSFLVLEVSKNFEKKVKVSDSIAVNGICLTLAKKDKGQFLFDVMNETIQKTNLQHTKAGDRVNLEPSLKVGDSMGGHFVSGHIDTTVEVEKIKEQGKSRVIVFSLPNSIQRYVAPKGSVTLNGVSLTVVDVGKDHFSVSLVDYTLKETNLSDIRERDHINFEIDMVARYLASLL